jgi:hypothetical protein
MEKDLTNISILARREIEARIVAPILKTLSKELGKEKACAIVRKAVQSLAKESGAQLARDLGGNSMQHLARQLALWGQGDALQVEFLEQDDQKFNFNIVRCRYAEKYKELGILEFGTLLSCERDFAFMEGFNPKIILTRTKTIMEGADHCDFRYSIKNK